MRFMLNGVARRTIGAAALLGLGSAAGAWDGPPEPGAAALLAKSRAAVTALKSVSYVAVVESAGEPGGAPASFSADVAMRRVEAGGWALKAKGSMVVRPGAGKPAGSDVVTPADGSAIEFEVTYDGITARSLRDAEKTVMESTAKDLADVRLFFVSQNAAAPVPWELADATPIPAGDGAAVTIDGPGLVGEEACQVLKVSTPGGPGGESAVRYFISDADALPRKIERVRTVKAPDGKPSAIVQSVTLTEFQTDVAIPGSMFVISVPDEYVVKVAGAKKTPRPVREKPAPDDEARDTGLLAVGSDAPAWSLTSAEGKARTLADLRGKVVVMDFWGTWCPWCVKAMPAIQKVHEKFAGKPVVVLGMNYEGNPNASPTQFMKEKGFTYEVILKAEKIAPTYKVRGWPTLYVIGADGKVLFAESGYNPRLEEQLTEVIERGVKDAGV